MSNDKVRAAAGEYLRALDAWDSPSGDAVEQLRLRHETEDALRAALAEAETKMAITLPEGSDAYWPITVQFADGHGENLDGILAELKRYRAQPKVEPVADSPALDCPRESENRNSHGQSASARELCKQLRVRLATRLREAEIEAHEWELVSGANYRDTIVLRADLAAMTKERDKALRMFKAAVAGQAIGWAEVSTKGAA